MTRLTTAKGSCAFLAIMAAAAIALMFDAPPSAQADTAAIPRGVRGASNAPAIAVTHTVTTTADSSIFPPVGSLREAILFASSGDTINFSVTLPATITLTGAQLFISKDLTITGPGASVLGISGGNLFNVFQIDSGNVAISGLTIRDGGGVAEGGGINNAGVLTLTNSVVISNTAASSGAGILNGGSLYLSNAKVLSNTAPSSGGGLYNNSGKSVTIDQSTFSGNNAIGGGVYNLGFLTVTNSTLSGNAGAGGGIWSAASSTVVMTNTTVSGHPDVAIYLVSNSPGAVSAALWNSDVISNASTGISLDVAGAGVTTTLSLHNSIVGYNAGGNFAVYSGTVTSLGYNLSDGTIPHATLNDQENVPDLGIAPLGNYGGPTQTHGLWVGSHAINTGDNSGCPATDQRGISRPRTGPNPCDIGAFEGELRRLFLPLIKR